MRFALGEVWALKFANRKDRTIGSTALKVFLHADESVSVLEVKAEDNVLVTPRLRDEQADLSAKLQS